MIDNETLIQVLEASERRRVERRRFMQIAGGATLAAGLAACSGSGDGTTTPTPTPTPTPSPTASSTVALDLDYLNFALNFEYLEAEYFLRATTGAGISALPAPLGGPTVLTGVGTQGTVTGGALVNFTDPLNAQYAREIAADELAHVDFLRSMTGDAAVAEPAIDISSSATGGFTKLAIAGGFIPAGGTFDPYASDLNFMLGAFLLEDVVVTAYCGLIPLITAGLYINAVGGILATEAHHAALVRSQLYMMGAAAQTAAGQFSNARDALDGATDDDQGVVAGGAANITPTDTNGIVYSRTTGQTLNIFYANHAAVVGGGFFPAGINGNFLTMSAAN